jgi:hypothetical protein
MPTPKVSNRRARHDALAWRLAVREVRRLDGNLFRWVITAQTLDIETVVYADALARGSTLWIHTDYCSGTSGDAQLDELICERIAREVARRRFVRQAELIGLGAR